MSLPENLWNFCEMTPNPKFNTHKVSYPTMYNTLHLEKFLKGLTHAKKIFCLYIWYIENIQNTDTIPKFNFPIMPTFSNNAYIKS